MDVLGTGVFVLFVLLPPVSCQGFSFTAPITCYFVDGVLILYCIIATAFYFKEKFSNMTPVDAEASTQAQQENNNGGIYQELEGPKDADPYQVLEPTKKKKKAKKPKAKPTPVEAGDKDPYESLLTRDPAPPLSPR